MKQSREILIVGAGLAGTTIARVLAENLIKVKILEKRNHIAGNAFDFINQNNERIHKYGPHLLHCNRNSIALSFLSRFTEWIDYEHKVRALLSDGRTTPLPINQITLDELIMNLGTPDQSFENEGKKYLFYQWGTTISGITFFIEDNSYSIIF